MNFYIGIRLIAIVCLWFTTIHLSFWVKLLIGTSIGSHIADICEKLRSICGKFNQLHRTTSRHTLMVIYYARADSLFSYGLIIYGRPFISYWRSIKEDLQLRLIKFLVSNKEISVTESMINCFPSTKDKNPPIDKKVNYLITLEHYYRDENKVIVTNRYNTRSVRENMLV